MNDEQKEEVKNLLKKHFDQLRLAHLMARRDADYEHYLPRDMYDFFYEGIRGYKDFGFDELLDMVAEMYEFEDCSVEEYVQHIIDEATEYEN